MGSPWLLVPVLSGLVFLYVLSAVAIGKYLKHLARDEDEEYWDKYWSERGIERDIAMDDMDPASRDKEL